jgi:RHS repeat-associated protein
VDDSGFGLVLDFDGNRKAVLITIGDPFGRRIRKTVHRSWDGTAWTQFQQTKTYTYFYIDEGLAAEYVQDGTGETLQGNPRLLAEYGWEPDGLWGTNPIWIRTQRQDNGEGDSGNEGEAEYFYYQNDHLGTPQQIIDSRGNVVWKQKTTAFGETKIDPESTITNYLRFPGQYFDLETHTNYNFFRDYSPIVGRYMQEDPIGLDGGVNTFVYVGGNPLSWMDPHGLTPVNGIPADGSWDTYYGNWCGKNWSGACNGPIIPSNPAKPIDSLDSCCMDHDYCYAKYECDTCMPEVDKEAGKKECDKTFLACLYKLRNTPLYHWPKPPPRGTEANAYGYFQKAMRSFEIKHGLQRPK